jgi:endoribonuclease LACTB2
MMQELSYKDQRLAAQSVDSGVTQISLSNRMSRWQGFMVTCYLVDDILIDTGFAKAGRLLAQFTKNLEVNAICCTHNHEDHAGNCARLANQHACPVYLRGHDKLWDEGVKPMAVYRRIWWGRPQAYQPLEMPEVVEGRSRTLQVIAIPGHSRTQAAFFDAANGLVFVGDLYVSAGVTAVMSHENPYQSVQSLRRIAALKPHKMFNGHGLIVEQPAEKLLDKAAKIEAAAGQVVAWHREGIGERRILDRLFENGCRRDWLMDKMTSGEFSRKNFIRACINHESREA